MKHTVFRPVAYPTKLLLIFDVKLSHFVTQEYNVIIIYLGRKRLLDELRDTILRKTISLKKRL